MVLLETHARLYPVRQLAILPDSYFMRTSRAALRGEARHASRTPEAGLPECLSRRWPWRCGTRSPALGLKVLSRGRTFVATVLAIAIVMASVRNFDLASVMWRVPVWAMLVFPPGIFIIGAASWWLSSYRLWKRPNDRDTCCPRPASPSLPCYWRPHTGEGAADRLRGSTTISRWSLVFAIAIVDAGEWPRPTVRVEHRRELTYSLLAFEVVMLAIVLVPLANQKTARLETSWGRLYLTPADASVAHQIIDFTLAQKEAGRRVVVLPEGHMIYALTGTEAPSRWETIIPGILSPPQEEQYIADLNRAGAKYIILTNRKTVEYGTPYFGIDYNRRIFGWIEANYRVAGQFGQFHRDESRGWAALLYERRTSARPRPATSELARQKQQRQGTLSR